ncbi:MAG: CDP-alcohol phosphatidyltransferase family protein [Chloroflexi bacterium]|nr:CDP-alcohol phosphatidyltransferase family protein [Chloroflexota bacterium]
MIVAKQVADLITAARALIAVYLVWSGIARGSDSLTLIAWVMIANWTGDILDGRIARRSRVQYRTWIGEKDLEVDMVISIGLLIYMQQAGFVNIWSISIYLLLWGVYFLRHGGIPSSLGMLFQAPIYGWFIWVALHDAPQAGWAIIIFIGCAVALTWPHFPNVMVPRFLRGLRSKQNK